MPNAWNNRLFKPSYPRIPAESYSREDDITFSFKRSTSYPEVLNLLSRSGCFEPEDYLEAIKMMQITKSTDNDQGFITSAVTYGQIVSTPLQRRRFTNAIPIPTRRFWSILVQFTLV